MIIIMIIIIIIKTHYTYMQHEQDMLVYFFMHVPSKYSTTVSAVILISISLSYRTCISSSPTNYFAWLHTHTHTHTQTLEHIPWILSAWQWGHPIESLSFSGAVCLSSSLSLHLPFPSSCCCSSETNYGMYCAVTDCFTCSEITGDTPESGKQVCLFVSGRRAAQLQIVTRPR